MQKWIQILKLRQLNVAVFSICIILSFVFWLLSNLSESQKSYVPFKITYNNFPEDYVVVNALPKEIHLELESQGFELLKYELYQSNNEIVIDLNKVNFIGDDKKQNGIWLSSQALGFMEKQLKNKSEIIGVSPDTIHFRMEKEMKKVLPVKLNVNLKDEEGFKYSGFQVIPDSLNLIGPVSYFSNNEFVELSLDSITEFTDSISIDRELDLGKGLESLPKNVQIVVWKENIVKHTIRKEVKVLNQPKGFDVKLFPSSIEVSFYCTPSERKLVNDKDFIFTVDYNDIKEGESNLRITVSADKYPSNVTRLKMSPGRLEYIIQRND